MTDDIVTRLRDTAYETDVCWEAAKEIERLRAALAIAAGMISTMPYYEHEHPESIMNMLLAEPNEEALNV